MEIRVAAILLLTAFISIHLDQNPNFPKLNMIIEVTGAFSCHGFLPVLVRCCIASLTGQNQDQQDATLFPWLLATALLSFLYHLARYKAGVEALVSSGLKESLLQIVMSSGSDRAKHITFVTSAKRVISLITTNDDPGSSLVRQPLPDPKRQQEMLTVSRGMPLGLIRPRRQWSAPVQAPTVGAAVQAKTGNVTSHSTSEESIVNIEERSRQHVTADVTVAALNQGFLSVLVPVPVASLTTPLDPVGGAGAAVVSREMPLEMRRPRRQWGAPVQPPSVGAAVQPKTGNVTSRSTSEQEIKKQID